MKLLYKILFVYYQYGLLLYGRFLSIFLKPNPKEKSVLYLAAFFPENAGFHWRVKKWAGELTKEGYSVSIRLATNKELLDEYPQNTYRFLFHFFVTRFSQVLAARQYETVIVRRELLLFNQYGNHGLEKLLRKMCANVILDIDDDLSASKRQPAEVNSLFGKLMGEDGNSFRNSFAYYDQFIVASKYLKAYVQEHGGIAADKITVIPTCVDYNYYPAKSYESNTPTVFGWIGGVYNYPLLKQIIPILNELSTRYSFELHVIGNGQFEANSHFPIVNKVWSLQTEVADLLRCDIGLMPLDNSEESKGKGGFKLIQYMGLGIVSVASGVTINNDIVDQGSNSFLYQTDEELKKILEDILQGKIDLAQMGQKARTRIEKEYSFSGNRAEYLKIMKPIRS